MPTKKRARRPVPQMIVSVVRPVTTRLSRIEDLLLEIRHEQDVKFRKISAIAQRLDELTEGGGRA